MLNKLEEKKKKVDEQIEKNLLKKKLLLAQEKKKRAAKFKDIGMLAYKANIDQLDEQALLGAFLEISKHTNDGKLKQWKDLAEEFSKTQSKHFDQVYSICFLEDPGIEIKQKLKENKFSWNRFRKEYYGKGQKSEIEALLKNSKYKIEEIAN
ncbi:conjugal transfer protein TraD [Candidatus Protochlamydia phocaeensis]|uniref:conjugal transfer protein TraD n=1 Tax=Candidatus Protochlamydia phocaeensis TaxID=1414722 RepID=UPI0008389F30|nr:conjugal transfer protein TraD [Candidatus Protochlamydia phocaeensis]